MRPAIGVPVPSRTAVALGLYDSAWGLPIPRSPRPTPWGPDEVVTEPRRTGQDAESGRDPHTRKPPPSSLRKVVRAIQRGDGRHRARARGHASAPAWHQRRSLRCEQPVGGSGRTARAGAGGARGAGIWRGGGPPGRRRDPIPAGLARRPPRRVAPAYWYDSQWGPLRVQWRVRAYCVGRGEVLNSLLFFVVLIVFI